MKATLYAQLFEITYAWDSDPDNVLVSHLGVNTSPNKDRIDYLLAEFDTDKEVFFWFDNVDDIKALAVGDYIVDDAKLLSLPSENPVFVTEIIEIPNLEPEGNDQ